MFFNFDFDNGNSFYSFICDALLEEAIKENVGIHFEYRFPNSKRFYDIYLENGLKRFGSGFNPIIVETKFKYDRQSILRFIKQVRDETRFFGKVVIVVYGEVSEKLSRNLDAYGVIVYGIELVNDLIKKHPNSYLNHLTSDKNINLNVKEDRKVEIVDTRKRRSRFAKIITKDSEMITISEDSPEKISEINEKKFKNLFRNNNERCALILGNGVSIPFGSDTWRDTIKNMADFLRPSLIENSEAVMDSLSNSTYAISSFVKSALFDAGLEDKYYEAIRYSIYRKYNSLMHKERTLVKVISDAKRTYGSLPVLTYNYDTFIERQYWYDSEGASLNYISGDESKHHLHDSVIHLHGYISYKKNNKNDIVLTDDEYFDTYFSKKNDWSRKLQKEVLLKYKCLFIGSSMSDIFQMSLISEVKEDFRNVNGEFKDSWNCYALLCFNNPNLGIKGKIRLLEFYQKRGVKVIFVDNHDKLPDKLKNLLS